LAEGLDALLDDDDEDVVLELAEDLEAMPEDDDDNSNQNSTSNQSFNDSHCKPVIRHCPRCPSRDKRHAFCLTTRSVREAA